MKRAQWTDEGIALADAEPAALPTGWARLRVTACGICGTDLHLLRQVMLRAPGVTPGHEMVGHPIDGPAGLDDALYAVEPRSWCGSCTSCLGGRRQLCPEGKLLGITASGGLAELVDAPPASLHRVPSGVEALIASLAEPLAVCVRAIHLAELEVDSRVLVLGGGSIGLLCGLLARERAGRVAVSARHPHQRAAVKALGLDPLAEDEAGEWAVQYGPDVVIETVGGRADTLDQAVRFCRPAGRVILLGVFGEKRPVDLLSLMAKEIRVIGSNTYGTDRRGAEFGGAVALLPRYAAELAPLLTHQFPLARLDDAFAAADDKTSGAIKVTLLMQ